MPKLPSISGKKLIALLCRHGAEVVRKKGSHVLIRRKLSNLYTVVPVHANEDLGKGLLNSILNDLRLEPYHLELMMKKKLTSAEMIRLDRLSH